MQDRDNENSESTRSVLQNQPDRPKVPQERKGEGRLKALRERSSPANRKPHVDRRAPAREEYLLQKGGSNGSFRLDFTRRRAVDSVRR